MTQNNLTRAAVAGFSLTAIAALLMACSSSDSGPSPVATTSFSGTLVDGYISGASIGVVTGGVCDTSMNVKSDVNGVFKVASTYANSTLCATGGVDTSILVNNQPQPLVGELRAPAGSTVITPLTTLVQAQIDQDKAAGKTTAPADAAAAIVAKLGLTGVTGPQLLTTDPAAKDTSGALVNKKLYDTGGKVQTLFATTAKTLASRMASGAASQPTDDQAGVLYSSAVSSILKAWTAASGTVDVTTAIVLQAALFDEVIKTINSQVSALVTAMNGLKNAIQIDLNKAIAALQSQTLANELASSVASVVNSYVPPPPVTNTTQQVTTSSTSTSTSTSSTTTTTTTTTTLAPLTTLAVSLPKINGVAPASGDGAAATPYVVTGPVNSASLTLSGTAGTSITTSVGFDIAEVICVAQPAAPGGSPVTDCTPQSRHLTLIVDKVILTKTTAGVWTGVVDTGAKLYASAKNSTGTAATVTQPQNNTASNVLSFDNNGALSVSWSGAVSNALAAAGLGSTLNLTKGTYAVKVVVNGVTLTGSNAATAILTIPAVTGTSAVTGTGVNFYVTVN